MKDEGSQGMVSTPYRASKDGRTSVWVRDAEGDIVAHASGVSALTTCEVKITEFEGGAFDVDFMHRGKLIGWVHFNNQDRTGVTD